ncbi:YncE family protein [Bacillus stratosphericus]|uniref:YncE family protein n=1 Tax=Bacillus stratosphericus TaxID=293386 RepID=UPI001CFADB13|nr:YncE family protein [Bacillus stratosphericus]
MERVKYFLVCLIVLLFFLSGCGKEQQFTPPGSSQSIAVISQLKKASFSIVDLQKKKIVSSVDLKHPLTDLIQINKDVIIATSKEGKSLIEINLKKGTATDYMDVNKGLTTLTYDTASNTLFVADSEKNVVYFIDTQRKKIKATVKTDKLPSSMTLSSSGTLFVLNAESHTVSVIDIEKEENIRTISVLERPSGIHFDGQSIWIGGHGKPGSLNKSIFAYDAKTGKQQREIKLGVMPVAFFSERNSSTLYVLCHGDHTLYKVDTKTDKQLASVETGQNPNYIAADTSSIYVSNLDDNSVSVIDKHTFMMKNRLNVPYGPYAIMLEEKK